MKNILPKNLKYWKSTQRFIDANAKNFNLIFFAFIVGLIAGLLGAVFRFTLSYVEDFRNNLYESVDKTNLATWWIPLLFGIIGISIALFLVKKYASEASGSGVQEIEGALDEIRPLRWKRVIPVKFIASFFSLGSGFLLGQEGPTIQIGANIGKMIKDLFKQPDEGNNPLVSAGAAAGLASAFNAPFSGVIFVIEEMHGHFKHTFFSVAAIMLASGTADLVSRIIVGAAPVIEMRIFSSPPLSTITFFIILGVLLGLIGYIFNSLIIKSLNLFSNLAKRIMNVLIAILGITIVAVGVFCPDMIGGGYAPIKSALDNSYNLQFLIILFAGRLFLTIISYGVGLPGGIFAPLLSLGVLLGMFFGNITQFYFPELISNPAIFAVAGMAGIFAATVRAPITGLILAVEMTSNFELLLPLIFTVVSASLFTTLIGNQPIYTSLLKRSLEMSKTQKSKKQNIT
jgi:CIC family chloride channel protein